MLSARFFQVVLVSILVVNALVQMTNIVGQRIGGLAANQNYRPERTVVQRFYPLSAIGDACQSPTGCDASKGLACHNFSCVHCSRVCETCRYDHDCCNGLGCGHDGFCHGSDRKLCQRLF